MGEIDIRSDMHQMGSSARFGGDVDDPIEEEAVEGGVRNHNNTGPSKGIIYNLTTDSYSNCIPPDAYDHLQVNYELSNRGHQRTAFALVCGALMVIGGMMSNVANRGNEGAEINNPKTETVVRSSSDRGGSGLIIGRSPTPEATVTQSPTPHIPTTVSP